MPQPKKIGRGNGKLTEDQWLELGAKYEAGATVSQLARDYGVSRKAIQKQIDKRGWKQDLERVVAERVAAKVAGAVARDPVKIEAAIEEEADRRAGIIRKHREEWLTVEDLQREALAQRQGKRNPDGTVAPPSFEPFKQMKITAETLEIKQRAERKAWNIEDKPLKVEHSGEFGDHAKKPLDEAALKGKSLAELTTMFQEEVGASNATK